MFSCSFSNSYNQLIRTLIGCRYILSLGLDGNRYFVGNGCTHTPTERGYDQFHLYCRNPNLAKCGGEAQHLEKLGIWSPPGLPNVQSSTARGTTPRIGVLLASLKRSWNVDIENALALAIRTSVAQVMGKRRAESQTASLTPDH
jgi:hypothetical protein